ncbi:MAG: hypothetical protein U0610_25050 [bacterium]
MRWILGRVTPRSALAAFVELAFAYQCMRAARTAFDAQHGSALFEALILVAIEGFGLALQRMVWLGGASARKASTRSLVAMGWGALGLAVSAPALIVSIVLGAAASPRSGILWIAMLARRIWWAWDGRARTPKQHERLGAYWRLAFRVQALAALGATVLAFVLSSRYGGLDEAVSTGALVTAGAGIYFCILAFFVLRNDPRAWAQRGFVDPAARGARRAAVAPLDLRRLVTRFGAGYPRLLPGIALIVVFTEFLSASSAAGASVVAWPLWFFASAWWLMGGAARALGITAQSPLRYGFERVALSTFVGIALWLSGLVALAASAAVAAAYGGYRRDLAELPWQVEAWFAAGAVVALYGFARVWPAYVNLFLVEGTTYKGRWFAPSLSAGARMTGSADAMWRGSLPLFVLASVLLAPTVWALAGSPGLGGRVLAKLWLYAAALPFLAVASVERARAMRAALAPHGDAEVSAPAPDP